MAKAIYMVHCDTIENCLDLIRDYSERIGYTSLNTSKLEIVNCDGELIRFCPGDGKTNKNFSAKFHMSEKEFRQMWGI